MRTAKELIEENRVIGRDNTDTFFSDEVEKLMLEYAEDAAIDYAYWLFERVFSKLMERPDREGRKLFYQYQQEKSSLK